jgi:alkylation response protein AidB-like acyl-CoA dehydrogenase
MRRNVYTQEHEDFRAMIRAFIESEVVPVHDEWFEAGITPRDFYYKLGELGLFGIEIPTEYGGSGIDSYKFQAIITEETSRARCPSAVPACTSGCACPT